MPGLPGGAYPGQVLFPLALTSSTDVHVTQAVVETISKPTPAARVTQVTVNVLHRAATRAAVVTQVAIDVLGGLAAPPIAGAAALVVPVVALSASGTVLPPALSGSGALVVPPMALSGAGTAIPPGNSGQIAATEVVLTASGTVLPPPTSGSGGVTAPPVVLAGAGDVLEPEAFFSREPVTGLTWVEFTDAAGTTHVWSDVALPDPASYYFGLKDNRVTQWGTIRRSLSDDAGQYVGSELSWTVSDADRRVRALLADPATRAFANRAIAVRMIPDADRRALARPRDVYLGIVRDYSPAAPLTFDFTARDYFDAIFNPAGDQQFPRRVITTADFPKCNSTFIVGRDAVDPEKTPGVEVPVAALNLPVPIIYGHITDQHVVDGVDDGDGQCPAILVGTRVFDDGEYYEFLVAGHACQHIDELYVNNDPQNLATDDAVAGLGGRWKVPGYAAWAAEFPTPYRDINGHRYTLVYGKRGPETTLNASTVGYPTVLDMVDSTSTFVDGAEAIFVGHQGASPTIDGVHIITIVDDHHVSIDLEVTQAGTGGVIRQAFGPDIAAGATEPRGQSVPFALDVRGIEDRGDGTGTLILDGPLQYLHCLLNWIIGDYQTGNWTNDPPVMPDASALPMVAVESFLRCNDIAHARLAGGYRGDFVLGYTAVGPGGKAKIGGERVTARDLLQRFNASFDMDVGFNRHSQFMASMTDDSDEGRAAMATAPLVQDMTDVVKDSLTITDDVPQLYNRIPFRDTEDYFNRMGGDDAKAFTEGKSDTNWRSLNSGVASLDDAASIAAYSTNPAVLTPIVAPTRLLYMVRSKTRSIDSDEYLQGSATTEDVVRRYLARHRDPPRTARFTVGLQGHNLDLGDVLRLTHFAGIGAQGWVEQPLRIVAHDADVRQQLVTLTTQDLSVGGAPPPIPPDGCTWVVVYAQPWAVVKSSGGALWPDAWARPPLTPDAAHPGATIDPDYPEIVGSEAVKTIVASGDHWLTTDRSGGSDGVEDSVTSGAWLRFASPLTLPHGRLTITYQLTAAAWDEAYNHVFLTLLNADPGDTWAIDHLQVSADFWDAPGGDFHVFFKASAWDSANDFEIEDVVFTRAAYVDRTITIQVEWHCATVTGDPAAPTVAMDGWVRLRIDGVLIYEHTDFDFVLTRTLAFDAATPPGIEDQLGGCWIGYYGLFGNAGPLVIEKCTTGSEPVTIRAGSLILTDHTRWRFAAADGSPIAPSGRLLDTTDWTNEPTRMVSRLGGGGPGTYLVTAFGDVSLVDDQLSADPASPGTTLKTVIFQAGQVFEGHPIYACYGGTSDAAGRLYCLLAFADGAYAKLKVVRVHGDGTVLQALEVGPYTSNYTRVIGISPPGTTLYQSLDAGGASHTVTAWALTTTPTSAAFVTHATWIVAHLATFRSVAPERVAVLWADYSATWAADLATSLRVYTAAGAILSDLDLSTEPRVVLQMAIDLDDTGVWVAYQPLDAPGVRLRLQHWRLTDGVLLASSDRLLDGDSFDWPHCAICVATEDIVVNEVTP